MRDSTKSDEHGGGRLSRQATTASFSASRSTKPPSANWVSNVAKLVSGVASVRMSAFLRRVNNSRAVDCPSHQDSSVPNQGGLSASTAKGTRVASDDAITV